MTFAETMKAKAKALQKALVLPEGTEPRTVAAARMIVDQHLASHVTLLGKVDAVAAVAAQHNISLAGIQVIDPEQSPLRQAYADEYYQLRKHKGMTEQEAYEGITSVLRWGARFKSTSRLLTNCIY